MTTKQTPRPRRIIQAYADTNGVPPTEAMQTAGTAAHSAPRWAADPSTDVEHERGEGVHPDDAHTSYTRQLATWETTPEQAHLSRSTLQVTLHAWRHDDGSDDRDTTCVWEHGIPEQHLVAADARRLGQVLLRAADELEDNPKGV